ncbi:MAG TPA: phosphate ABC transporter permease subunit PstC [Acidimicrobiales bacterium]|nr:phosphate ABC transporter permease subunit PstC [Acidimicrobiales bacterium]
MSFAPPEPALQGSWSKMFAESARRSRLGGRAYGPARWLGAAVFAAAVLGVVVSIATGSAQAFAHYGPSFAWSGRFAPGTGQYGAGLLLVGTIVTTGVALVLAAPVGLGAAIALAELVPARVAAVSSTAVELLAAVPSIVVGLWALLVLEPSFGRHVEPFLRSIPLVGRAFGGPAYGPSILLAAVVLAVMVLPTLVALSRTALSAVPVEEREAAMALGATRWQVVREVVLPAARPGVGAAVTLATGRALGEAIAVAMVIGNSPSWPHSLSGPGATLGSAIVNQFAEAQPGLGTSSVIALGAVLFVLTVAVNAAGQGLRRAGQRVGSQTPPPGPAGPAASIGLPFTPREEGERSAVAWRTLQRRQFTGRLAQGLCLLALAASAAPLVALVGYTIARAAPALSLGLLIHPVVPEGVPGGGIATAIAGSARAVGLALLMAAPVGLVTALFLYERAGPLAWVLRFSADVLAGVPSIVIGVFAFEAVVRPVGRPSTWAASVALAVLMLPVVVRADEEAIRSVPVELQEAGAALAATRWRVVRSIVLRGSLPGLVSGNLLALSRAVGETAPLLFTLATPSFAMTTFIYENGTQAFPSAQHEAWAAALVLLVAVLALSALARGIAWSFSRRAR